MENFKEMCFQIVIDTIRDYSTEIGYKIEEIDHGTRLIGHTSPFDSSDLVQLIVEIEDRINNKFESSITLTDEKAMSRSTSPFINVETLVNFIVENLK